jgi:regulator of cell morphogenesis and NO signaling
MSDREPESQTPLERLSTAALVDHIVRRYHEPLRRTLVDLEALGARVVDAEGAREPRLAELVLPMIVALRRELEPHMAKEERVLFPRLLTGDPHALSVLAADHDADSSALTELTQLRTRLRPPPDASDGWVALWDRLRQVDADLREHQRIERDILPRTVVFG